MRMSPWDSCLDRLSKKTRDKFNNLYIRQHKLLFLLFLVYKVIIAVYNFYSIFDEQK